MFKVTENLQPLARLISQKKKMTYQLMVRGANGKVAKLPCEMQIHTDFIFSARTNKYELGERVLVKTVTLKGAVWQPCKVTYIEEHIGYSLFQFSVLLPKSESKTA